ESGHNTYAYDDENRLTSWAHYQAGPSSPENGDTYTDFVYDGLSRLRKRLEYIWENNSQAGSRPPPSGPPPTYWVMTNCVLYTHAGLRVIQERDTNSPPTVSYTRGSDLSGSLEGAGGIGGLLARSSGYSAGNWSTHNFYHADANGNITYLETSSQTLAASYRYDPFGNTISSSGTYAAANVYRFSSKEFMTNCGMYYYLYRFYDPNLQRWINRDPIQELGGINLYTYLLNALPTAIDPIGLQNSVVDTTGHPVGGSQPSASDCALLWPP